MNNVEYIEKNLPHYVSEIVCIKCLKRWIAVRPLFVKLKDIHCDNCGDGFAIETGENIEYED